MTRKALFPALVLALLAASGLSALAPASARPAHAARPAPVNLVAPDGVTTLQVWAALDPTTGAPYLAGAERPAVLVVPGWNCTPAIYQDVARFLSGRGYVVALFDHEGNTDAFPDNWAVWVEASIDLLVAESLSPLSPLFHEIDPLKIGLVGHSEGGAAAVLVASMDFRVKALELAGPQSGDPTFLAAAYAIQAPILTVDGSLDRLAPPAQCSDVVVAHAASADKAQVVIQGGNHTNCPADFDLAIVRDTGRWVLAPIGYWPFYEWTFEWPIVPGLKPIPGDQQRAVAFPYMAAWLDRFLDGQKDPQGWTTGKQADAQVKQGILASDSWSAAARKAP